MDSSDNSTNIESKPLLDEKDSSNRATIYVSNIYSSSNTTTPKSSSDILNAIIKTESIISKYV
jgi:hypothetical protein